MPAHCAYHEQAAASHRCDGCRRDLCPQCLTPSHRLLLCGFCGEQVIPLRATTPKTLRGFQIEQKTGHYGYLRGLFYVYRGLGGWAFFFAFVLSVVFSVVVAAGVLLEGFVLWPFVKKALFIGETFFFLMVGAMQGRIVTDTAAGSNIIPDWPEPYPLELMRAGLRQLVIGWFPVLVLVVGWLTMGCEVLWPFLIFNKAHCLYLGIAWVFIAWILWIPAVGAAGMYESVWLTLRYDLHVRAAFVNPLSIIKDTLCWLVMIAAGIFGFVWLPTQIASLGWAIGLQFFLVHLWSVYVFFTTSHLVGLYWRKNRDALKDIYQG